MAWLLVWGWGGRGGIFFGTLFLVFSFFWGVFIFLDDLFVWSTGSLTRPPSGGHPSFSNDVFLRAALFSLFCVGDVFPGCRLCPFSFYFSVADDALSSGISKISKYQRVLSVLLPLELAMALCALRVPAGLT